MEASQGEQPEAAGPVRSRSLRAVLDRQRLGTKLLGVLLLAHLIPGATSAAIFYALANRSMRSAAARYWFNLNFLTIVVLGTSFAILLALLFRLKITGPLSQLEREVAYFVAERLSPLETVLSTATHFVLKRYKVDGDVLEERTEVKRLPVTP